MSSAKLPETEILRQIAAGRPYDGLIAAGYSARDIARACLGFNDVIGADEVTVNRVLLHAVAQVTKASGGQEQAGARPEVPSRV